MTLKLTAIGNSTGVILPKEVLEQLKLEKGDTLHLTSDLEGMKLTPYDAEFLSDMALADEIMREDRDVLHKLAQ